MNIGSHIPSKNAVEEIKLRWVQRWHQELVGTDIISGLASISFPIGF